MGIMLGDITNVYKTEQPCLSHLLYIYGCGASSSPVFQTIIPPIQKFRWIEQKAHGRECNRIGGGRDSGGNRIGGCGDGGGGGIDGNGTVVGVPNVLHIVESQQFW